MAGLRGGHGNVDRLIVPHFSRPDNIRALAQRCTKGCDIAFRVHVDFALADDGAAMAVHSSGSSRVMM